MAEGKEKTGKREVSPVWVVSLVFFLCGSWVVGSSLYSRGVLSPALTKMAKDPSRWDDARRAMNRAMSLVFGRGIFAARANRSGAPPECVSSRALADVVREFEKLAAEEGNAAGKLSLTADPSAAMKYGPECAEYVAQLARRRAAGNEPSKPEAQEAIMRYVEAYVALEFAARFGEGATAVVMEYRVLARDKQLSDENRRKLEERWRALVEERINDFAELAAINGRNGLVFGAFLLVMSAVFLLIPILGRGIVPQDFSEANGAGGGKTGATS